MSYDAFARDYDLLTSDIDYKGAADFIDALIRQHGKKGILLDLGCGTGTMSFLMAEKGYDVIGADISDEMLSVALERKAECGLTVQFIRQDMTTLDMFGTVDAVICTLDGLNHLASREDIAAAMERTAFFCEEKALFIFDMNTPYKHTHVLSGQTFVYDRDEVYCVWENSEADTDDCFRVDMQLDLFEREGDVYYRDGDTLSEIALPADDIAAMLDKAGFDVIGRYDGYTDAAPTDTTERIVWAARLRKAINKEMHNA